MLLKLIHLHLASNHRTAEVASRVTFALIFALIFTLALAPMDNPASIINPVNPAYAQQTTPAVVPQTIPEITIYIDKTSVKEGEGFVVEASADVSFATTQTIFFSIHIPAGYNLIQHASQKVDRNGSQSFNLEFPAYVSPNTRTPLTRFSVVEDNRDSADGVITLTAYAVGDDFTITQPANFAIAVSDNDLLSIAPASMVMNEGETRNLTLSLSEAQNTSVKVFYVTKDDVATRGLDYVAKNGTIIFDPGETEKTINVTSVNNPTYSPFVRLFSVEANTTINGKAEKTASRITIIERESKPELTIRTADNTIRAGRGENVTFVIATNGIAYGSDTPIRLDLHNSTSDISDHVAISVPLRNNPSQISHIVQLPKSETNVSFTAQPTSNLSYDYLTIALVDEGNFYNLRSSAHTASIKIIEPEIGISVNATSAIGGERVEFKLAVENGRVSNRDIIVDMTPSTGIETFFPPARRLPSPDIVRVTLPAYANNITFTAEAKGSLNGTPSTLTLQEAPEAFPEYTLARNKAASVVINPPEISISVNTTSVTSGGEVTFTLNSSSRTLRKYPIRMWYEDGVDVTSFDPDVVDTTYALQQFVEVTMPPDADSVNFTARLYENSNPNDRQPSINLSPDDAGNYRINRDKSVAIVSVAVPNMQITIPPGRNREADLGAGDILLFRIQNANNNLPPSGTPSMRVEITGNVSGYNYNGTTTLLTGGGSNIIDLPWPLNAHRIDFEVIIADEFNLTTPNISASLLDGRGYRASPARRIASRGLTRKPILSIIPPSNYSIGHAQAQFGIRIDNDVYGEIGSTLPINLEVAGDVENILRIGDAQGQISVSPPEIVNLTIEAQRATIFGRLIPVGVPQNPTAPAILRLLPGEGYEVNPNANIASTTLADVPLPVLNITYRGGRSGELTRLFLIDVDNKTINRTLRVPIEVTGAADVWGNNVTKNEPIRQTPTIITATITTAPQPSVVAGGGDRTITILVQPENNNPQTSIDKATTLRLLPGLGYRLDPDASVAQVDASEPIVSIATATTEAKGGHEVTFTLTNNNTQNFTRPRSVKVRLDGDVLNYRTSGASLPFSGQAIDVEFPANAKTTSVTIRLADFPTSPTLTASVLDDNGYLTTSPTTASIPILKPTLSLTASSVGVAPGASVDYTIGVKGGGTAGRTTEAIVAVIGAGNYTHLGSGRSWLVANGPAAHLSIPVSLNNTEEVLRVTTSDITSNPMTAQLHPNPASTYLVDATTNNASNASVVVMRPIISIHGEAIANRTNAQFTINSSVEMPRDTAIAVDINGRDFSDFFLNPFMIRKGETSNGFIFPFIPGEDHLTATLGNGNYTLHPINYRARLDNPLPAFRISANQTHAEGGQLVLFTIKSDVASKVPLSVNARLNRTTSRGRETIHRIFRVIPGNTTASLEENIIRGSIEGPTIMTLLPGDNYRLDPVLAHQRAIVSPRELVVELSANRASIGSGQEVTFTIKTEGGKTAVTDRHVFIEFSGAIAGTSFSRRLPFGCRVLCTFPITLPANRPSVSFTAQASQVSAPSSIALTLQEGRTGYIPSASPARRRAQVRVTQTHEAVLDINATPPVVTGGKNITFTINSERTHDLSLDPADYQPSANTNVTLLVDGDLIGYTYNGTRFTLASTGSTPATPATIRLPWQANAHQISFIGHVDASPDTTQPITATILDAAGYDPHPNPANATASIAVRRDGTPLPQIAITANTTRTFKHQPVAFTLAVTNGITPLADIPILITHSEGVAGFTPSGIIARNLTTTPDQPLLEVTLPAGNSNINFTATIAGKADGSPSTITLLDPSTSNEYTLVGNPDLHQASIAIVKPQFIITNITSSIREGETLSDSNSHFRIESVHGALIDPVAVQVELAGDNANNNLIEFRYTGNANPSTHIFTSPYVATLNMSATRHAIEFGVKIGTSRDGTITARLLPPVLATPTSPAPYVLSTNTSHNSASIPIAQPEFTLAVKDNQTSVEGGYSAKFVLAASHAPLIDPRPINLRLGGAIESYTFAGNTTPLPPLAVGETRDIALSFDGRNTREELSLAVVDNPDNTSPISVALLDGAFYDPAPPPANTNASIPVIEPVFGLQLDEGLTPREAGESVNITIVNHNGLHPDRYAGVVLVSNKNAESWRNRGTLEGDRVRAGRAFTSQVNFLANATSNEANHVLTFVVADDATGAVEVELRDALGYRLGTGAGQNVNVTIPVRLPRLAITSNVSASNSVDEGETITFIINATNGIAPRVNRMVAVDLSDGFAEYRLAGGSPQTLAGPAPHRLQVMLPRGNESVSFTATISDPSDIDLVNATLVNPNPDSSGYTLASDPTNTTNPTTAQVRVDLIPIPEFGIYVVDDAGNEVAYVEYEESVGAGAVVIRTTDGSVLQRNVSVAWRVDEGEGTASINTSGVEAVGGGNVSGSGANFTARLIGGSAYTASATLIAGNTGVQIPMVLTADNAVDDAPDFFLFQLVLGGGRYTITPTSATLGAQMRIYDDDPAIAVRGDRYVNEGDEAVVHFEVIAPPAIASQPHIIKYQVDDPHGVTMRGTGEYTAEMPAGASNVSLMLATKNDDRATTGQDTFSIEILDNVTDGYRLATTHPTSLNITMLDNDVGLAITPADGMGLQNLLGGSNVDVKEGEAVNLTLRLDEAQPLPVIVSYATRDGTAEAGRDYDAMDTTITFQPGETAKNITLTTIDNGIYAPTDLQFSLIANATIAGVNRTASFVVIINDNDLPPEVGIYIVDADGNEVSNGVVEFEEGHPDSFALVIRTANSTALTDNNIILWEISQPASPVISAIDHPRAYNGIGRTGGVGSTTSNDTTANTTLTGAVAPQATNLGITLNVTLGDNSVDEAVMRELVWRLTPATSVVNNYTIAAGAGAVRVRLYDNDPKIALGSEGSGDVVFVNEGDTLHIPLRVEAGSVSGGVTTQPHQIIVQASDPLDLVAGAAGRINVPLMAGASEAVLVINTNENEVVDGGNRNFTLEVVHGLGDGYGLGGRTRQTIVVRDDDAVLSLTPTTSRVDEGEAVTLQLAINQPQPEAFNVTYATVAGTGVAGVDYGAVNASVEFAVGETSKTITLQTLNNTIDVLADVSFSVVANMSLYGVNQTRTALVAVADDDNSFDFTLTPSNVSVVEGSPARFTLTLSNPLGGATPFIVSYSTQDGTARAGVNYERVQNAQVEFQPGETNKTIMVDTLTDAIHTHNASLQFVLLVNATRDGTEFKQEAVGHVTEGGTPPVLTLALSAIAVDEGGAFIVSADSDRQSSLPLRLTFNITTPAGFSVTDGSTTYGGGSSVLQQVEFPARTTSHEFGRFMVAEDAVNADNGVFSVRGIKSAADTAFSLNTPNWLNVTLRDNDDDPVVGITASSDSGGGGQQVQFTIDGGGLATAGARRVAVDIMGGATRIDNGTHNVTRMPLANVTTRIYVLLAAGGGNASFTVETHKSSTPIPDIVAMLVHDTGYTINGDQQSARVSVISVAGQVAYALGFDMAGYHIMEGEAAQVGFTIDPPPPSTVWLNYDTSDGSGLAGQHYMGSRGRVRFLAGEGNKTIAVPTIQNDVASNTSVNFTMHANVIVNGLRLVGNRTITISDEDEMPLLSLTAQSRVRVGQNATVSINSNRTKPPQDRVVLVEINGTSVEAVYSSQHGTLAVGRATAGNNGSVTEGVVLPRENLTTSFVVQAKDADNLTPIVVRLLNGTGYMVHPDLSQQQAVILVQQRSGLAAWDVSTAILPQVVGALLDEVGIAVAGRSHAFFGDGGDGAGGSAEGVRGWQRLTIGGENVRSFAENYARGEAQREAAENPWDAPSASRLTQLPDVRLLRFNLAFGGRGTGSFAVWGQGFSRGLSGKYSAGGVEFEGDVPGRIIGIERRVRQSLLLGVGFSDISAKFDYTRRDDLGDIARGRHETDLRGYHPYLAWRLAGGGHVWATIGVSEGEVVIRQNGVADVYRSEVEAETASIGFNTLADGRRQADGSAVSLNFEGDVSYASIAETPTQQTRDAFLAARAIDLSVARVRLGGVISKHSVLDSGGIFRQSLRLAVRHDSGDILEGGAVELGASASLELVRGLTIDLSVRTLLFHEESLDELGLRGRIAWSAPDANGRGLQLVLAPRWGNTESQSDALLDGGYHYYAEAGSDGDDDARYAFDIRYGIPVFRGGLLTPFITGDAGDIAGASYGGLFTYGDFTAGVEAVGGDTGKAFSRYSRDF